VENELVLGVREAHQLVAALVGSEPLAAGGSSVE
jgi:hypothetical protein